jgi:hypothetical protein
MGSESLYLMGMGAAAQGPLIFGASTARALVTSLSPTILEYQQNKFQDFFFLPYSYVSNNLYTYIYICIWSAGVRFPTEARDVLFHSVQTGSGAHPVPSPTGTVGLIKVTGA